MIDPQGTRVCKFGGTSLADAARLRVVKAIVEADPTRRFVVVSAPGKRHADDIKVTDMLYACEEHLRRGEDVLDPFAVVRRRFEEMIRDLELDLDLASDFEEILREMQGGAGPDYVASCGEYLNARIVAALLGREFVDTAGLICFDAAGRFQAEETQRRMAARLRDLPGAVLPGFYGSRPDGTVQTFSRGGSDISGAIVARAVGAAVYENWTDVSGLLMADPRVVENPLPIKVVTYQELRELAYMGAGVLHDEAIFPVRQAGIPVHIRNTQRPDDAGTIIVRGVPAAADLDRHPLAITGIAGRKDFTVIALAKALMNQQIGYGAALLNILVRHGVSWEHIPSSIDTISVVVRSQELKGKLDAIQEEIRKECQPDELDIFPDIALIATVGRNMMHTPGMAARLFTALAEAGINVRTIDQGSSELNIIVGVEASDFEVAVRAIYEAFVPMQGTVPEPPPPLLPIPPSRHAPRPGSDLTP